MDKGPCDYKCPVHAVFAPASHPEVSAACCNQCQRKRKYFVTDKNEWAWSDDSGFLDKDGCRLPRESRPKECIKYDCKKERWAKCYLKYVQLVWDGTDWVPEDDGEEVVFVVQSNSVRHLMGGIGKNNMPLTVGYTKLSGGAADEV